MDFKKRFFSEKFNKIQLIREQLKKPIIRWAE